MSVFRGRGRRGATAGVPRSIARVAALVAAVAIVLAAPGAEAGRGNRKVAAGGAAGGGAAAAAAELPPPVSEALALGRGLHSSTSQLNLSRF